MEAAARKRSIVFMVICASLWSIAGIFIKLIPWNALVIAGWRSFIAAVCMAVFMLATGRRLKVNRASLLSGIFVSMTFLAFVSANKLTTAANAIVLQFTAPIFILILSAVFLHKRFEKADIITVIITLFGISLFFFDQLDGGGLLGNIIAIGAGFSMACMFVICGETDEESRLSGILFGHLLTAAIGLPFMLAFDTPFSSTAAVSILALGVVQLGIPYILMGLAVKHCPPLACSLIGAIEPLLNPVWVFMFDGERPGIFALIGGGIVIVTITLWCVWRDRKLQPV